MIIHDKEFVLDKLAHLPKLKYNKFQWWRSYGLLEELHHYRPLIERIRNGDFDPSPYFWMAQLAIHEMNEKIAKVKCPEKRREIQSLHMEKYRRLQVDYEKDEAAKLAEMRKSFQMWFKKTREELEEIMQDFVGDLEELYYYLENQKQPLCQN